MADKGNWGLWLLLGGPGRCSSRRWPVPRAGAPTGDTTITQTANNAVRDLGNPMDNFDFCFDVLMQHECHEGVIKPVGDGFVNNPADPGGVTCYGISMLMIKRLGIKPDELGLKDFSVDQMKQMKVESNRKSRVFQ